MQTIAHQYPRSSNRSEKVKFLSTVRLEGRSLTRDVPESTLPCTKHFMDRSWWSRTWILQEVILVRRASVHCGDLHVHMNSFFNLLDIQNDLLGDPHTSRVFIHSLWLLLQRMQSFKNLRLLASYPRVGFSTLTFGWNQTATDPGGKIYGLLGILPDVHFQTCARYDWPVERVYTEYVFSS